MADPQGHYHRTGNARNPIPVIADQTYTAPAGRVIVAVTPDPSWTGKAIAQSPESQASITADRTATGGDYVSGTAPFGGEYSSVSVTSGRVLVYEDNNP